MFWQAVWSAKCSAQQQVRLPCSAAAPCEEFTWKISESEAKILQACAFVSLSTTCRRTMGTSWLPSPDVASAGTALFLVFVIDAATHRTDTLLARLVALLGWVSLADAVAGRVGAEPPCGCESPHVQLWQCLLPQDGVIRCAIEFINALSISGALSNFYCILSSDSIHCVSLSRTRWHAGRMYSVRHMKQARIKSGS